MIMSVLEIKNLVAGYGPIIALHGVSMHVEQGELVSLVGANGAGKSTLLSSIIGLVKVSEGEIIYEGENLVGKKYYEIIRKRIAIVPEGRQVFPGMTVEENLKLGSFCLKNDPKRDNDTIEQVFEIIKKIKETGVTMMLIEQNANKALKISDRAYVLRTGNVIMEDKAENLLGNAALLESYLK